MGVSTNTGVSSGVGRLAGWPVGRSRLLDSARSDMTFRNAQRSSEVCIGRDEKIFRSPRIQRGRQLEMTVSRARSDVGTRSRYSRRMPMGSTIERQQGL
jgi:hypothetical protein